MINRVKKLSELFLHALKVVLFAAVNLVPVLSNAESVREISPNRFPVNVDAAPLELAARWSHSPDTLDPNIEYAVIVVHGAGRTSENYYNRMQSAASMVPGQLSRTFIFAPQFLEEDDIEDHNLSSSVLFWSSGWREGNLSRDTTANPRLARISSFAVIEQVVSSIIQPTVFPNLKNIVFAGHSAGAQYTHRFALGNRIHDSLTSRGIAVRYFAANPSSYVYLNPERRIGDSLDQFDLPTAEQIALCPDYDDYKYGLNDLNSYMNKTGISAILTEYPRRHVVYMLGELDTLTTDSLDLDCPAQLQGPNRLLRGQVFYAYLKYFYGPTIYWMHRIETVPGVGHSSEDIFTSTEGRDWLFLQPVPLPPPFAASYMQTH